MSRRSSRWARIENHSFLRMAKPSPSPSKTVDIAQNTKPKADLTPFPLSGGSPATDHDARQRTTSARSGRPDSKQMAFILGSQRFLDSAWEHERPNGSMARQITNLPLSERERRVVLARRQEARVHQQRFSPIVPDDACNKSRLDAENNQRSRPTVNTTLLYRHLADGKPNAVPHLFVVDVAGGPAKDLTPGDHDVPPFSLGGPDDYTISADSKGSLCYFDERRLRCRPPAPIRTCSWSPFIGGDSIQDHQQPWRGCQPANTLPMAEGCLS